MILIEDRGGAYGARLVTDEAYVSGQLIHRITQYRIISQPTYQTIQAGPDSHIEELGLFSYLNHSCTPNTIVDTAALTVSAARDIAPGEELSFFYPSTEWEMDRPFICLCNAQQCIRLVAGAKYLSIDALSRHFVNDHILEMLVASLRLGSNRFRVERQESAAGAGYAERGSDRWSPAELGGALFELRPEVELGRAGIRGVTLPQHVKSLA